MNTESTEKNVGTRVKVSLTIFWSVLKKFWVIVLVAAVLASVAVGAYRYLTKNKTYTASSKFSIINTNSKNEAIDNNTQTAASNLATTCVELVNTDYDALIELAAKYVLEDERLCAPLGINELNENEKLGAAKSAVKHITASKSDNDSEFFTISATSIEKAKAHAVVVAVQRALPEAMEGYFKIKPDSIIETTAKNTGAIPDDFTEANGSGYIRENGRGTVKYAVIGGAAATVVSYLICFFVFISDTKIYDESTVKENFEAPVLGVIPEWDIQANAIEKNKKNRKKHSSDVRNYKGKLLTKNTPFAVTEAFKMLRTNLCYSTAAEKCPVYAITSDFSGAGKSIISANVAISLALLGKKTLLVECDLRRPELVQIFETECKTGLSEMISGVADDMNDAIINVGVENLDVVLSGRIPPNPTELLGSSNMRSFIENSKEMYDIIIIDTPPAFEVSDVGVIMPMLSGVVIVARSNYSDIKAIKASEELITGVKGKIVGYVVNDVNIKSTFGYHNKKYGYRHYYKYARYSSPYTNTDGEAENKN